MTGQGPDPAGAVRIIPVADRAVLVEFGREVSDDTISAVRSVDRRLAAARLPGVVEVVPSGVNALVVFDPMTTDHDRVADALDRLLHASPSGEPATQRRTVEVCYEEEFAPDLAEVADRTDLTPEEVVAAHTGAAYRVVMFGFAPGAAYLRGLDRRIQLPRKTAAVRDVPAGSVIIAGEQCLVMPITMPTGWFVVGRAVRVPQPWETGTGITVDVGDEVRFVAVDRSAFTTREGDR